MLKDIITVPDSVAHKLLEKTNGNVIHNCQISLDIQQVKVALN